MSDCRSKADYSIVIECQKSLVSEDDELDDFTVRLMHDPSHGDDERKRRKVGYLHAIVARRGRGCSMYDACDSNSQLLYEAWDSLYTLQLVKKRGQSFQREELRDESFDGSDGGFMYVESVRVSPKHRGRRLGLRMLERLLCVVGHDLTAVVLEACPFNADDMSKEKADAGRAALAKYYAELGFRPFRNKFMVLELPLE